MCRVPRAGQGLEDSSSIPFLTPNPVIDSATEHVATVWGVMTDGSAMEQFGGRFIRAGDRKLGWLPRC